MMHYRKLIDISQPVKSNSAVFPGDTAFKRELILRYEDSKIVNLSSFSMSPHVGTHVDAPAHIKGDMTLASELVGNLPLEAFIGPAYVVDLAPWCKAIDLACLQEKLKKISYLNGTGEEETDETPARSAHAQISDDSRKRRQGLPPRLLFKTQKQIRYEIFEDNYAYFASELVAELHERGVRLLGIDTPSADHINSKTLDAHHELDRLAMTWLENLDLCRVSEGPYYLVAFPIRFEELEASPVRAVLLEF